MSARQARIAERLAERSFVFGRMFFQLQIARGDERVSMPKRGSV